MKKVVVYILLIFLVLSCIDYDSSREKKRNFSFRIPEMDLTVTTSKQAGGRFYIIFTKDSITSLPDSIVFLPDTIDYIANETHEMGPISFILDPIHKDSIYINETEYIEYVQSSRYRLCVLKYQDYKTRFFEPQIRTKALMLKYPYIRILIYTDMYIIEKQSFKITLDEIKEGSIYGY